MRLNTNNICLYCLHDTGGKLPCPTCRCKNPFNYENSASEKSSALKPGTILNEGSSPILIGRYLGAGGFGITYLALDVLGKIIVVKEFMPQNVAGRASDFLKIIAYKDQEDIYKYGLEKFVDEAKILATSRFPEHPNIVTILTLFEENNTAYFTMVYRQGMTLEQYIVNKGSKGINQQELLDIMREVLNGLKAVHNEAIFHRDIKPSNIYIPNKDEHDTKPFLLDFGSARQAMRGSDMANKSVFLTPGYAPVEQYKKTEKQGAYTDIYACAATIYACMRGNLNRGGGLTPPPQALEICSGNVKLEPVEKVSRQPVTMEFSQAVHLGMQCKPHKRPQSVAKFEEILKLSSPVQPPSSESYELLGIAGEYEGVTIPLNEPMIFGRSPNKCNLVILNHHQSRVSGKHCQLEIKNGKVYLQDFSRNGTTINDNVHNKINNKTTTLEANDTISLEGEAIFKIIKKPVPVEFYLPGNSSTPTNFGQRVLAWFIDIMLLIAGQFIILFISIWGGFVDTQLEIILEINGFVMSWLYYATMESSRKQATVGKIVLGIKVTGISGQRISFGRASGRFVGKILSSFILMIGFLMPIFTQKKQALHDMIAECLVVSKI
jgi:serine/threonine protein kinase